MKIQIKSRLTAAVLFEHICEGNNIRMTLELAVESGADLSYADLSGANLSRADLCRADLRGTGLSYANLSYADLSHANLSGANMSRADLRGTELIDADLSYADLSHVNLSGADLSDANLSYAKLKNREKLVGKRPIFQIGPIGSRGDYFVAYITDQGLRFDAGCQRQITREVFEQRLAKLHGENDHAKEYRAALALIDAHAEIWTPKNAHVTGADPSGMDGEKMKTIVGTPDYVLDVERENESLRAQLFKARAALAKAEATIAKAEAALAAPQPSADEPVTDSYVQTVPDKCDRIVWRGRYIHLSVGQETTPQPSYDDWIPWEGGDCPVAHSTIVDVRLRNQGEGRAVASNWRWYHETRGNSILEGADIIFYRVVKP